MQRRDFYMLVAESGVDPRTLRGHLSGKLKTHPAIAQAIELAAAKLGVSAEPAKADAV